MPHLNTLFFQKKLTNYLSTGNALTLIFPQVFVNIVVPRCGCSVVCHYYMHWQMTWFTEILVLIMAMRVSYEGLLRPASAMVEGYGAHR